MNIQVKIPDRSQTDSSYSKLALMTLCAVFLVAAIARQLPASAAETSASATVGFADLDLSTEKGMQTARDRIHATARRLCSRVVDPWSISHQPDFVQCVNEATTAAVTELQGPMRVASTKPHADGISTR